MIGITKIKFSDYLWGMLAIVIPTIAYVFVGTTIYDIEEALETSEGSGDT